MWRLYEENPCKDFSTEEAHSKRWLLSSHLLTAITASSEERLSSSYMNEASELKTYTLEFLILNQHGFAKWLPSTKAGNMAVKQIFFLLPRDN